MIQDVLRDTLPLGLLDHVRHGGRVLAVLPHPAHEAVLPVGVLLLHAPLPQRAELAPGAHPTVRVRAPAVVGELVQHVDPADDLRGPRSFRRRDDVHLGRLSDAPALTPVEHHRPDRLRDVVDLVVDPDEETSGALAVRIDQLDVLAEVLVEIVDVGHAGPSGLRLAMAVRMCWRQSARPIGPGAWISSSSADWRSLSPSRTSVHSRLITSRALSRGTPG